MLKACESFPEGCIIFLDELDALATSRSTGVCVVLASLLRCLGACCNSLLALVPLLVLLPLHVHARSLPASSSSSPCACSSLCFPLNLTLVAEMHEATRRVLGVLLRHLDGFDSAGKRTVVIGATNRKQVGALGPLSWQMAFLLAAQTNSVSTGTSGCGSMRGCQPRPPLALCCPRIFVHYLLQDLDPALISRFSTSVNFGLPSEACRCACGSISARALQPSVSAKPGRPAADMLTLFQCVRAYLPARRQGRDSAAVLPPLGRRRAAGGCACDPGAGGARPQRHLRAGGASLGLQGGCPGDP
jgi:hypothetical protein